MIYHLTKVVDALEDPTQFIDVRFASFLSGGFTTMAVINPPETKLANLCALVEITAYRQERIFQPMRALKFITGNIVYNLAYT